MYKIIVVLMMVMSCSYIAIPQSSSTLIGGRPAGVGYASACLSDQWSMFNNVAGLGKIKDFSVGCSYDAQPKLTAFNRLACVVNIPNKVSAGVGFFRFGRADYQEQLISLGCGSSWGITSVGLKVNFIRYSVSGFGDRSVFSLSFGGITTLTPRLSVGAHIQNINQSLLSRDQNERLPTVLTVGVMLKASSRLIACAELEKDLDYTSIIKAGVEYSLNKKFVFRSGFNFHPAAAFFGMGFRLKKFTADYAMQYNPGLGSKHQAGITYWIKSQNSL